MTTRIADAVMRDRIDELLSVHRSWRALGRALHIDPAYLVRLKQGEKTMPSDDVLDALGLDRVIRYERRER